MPKHWQAPREHGAWGMLYVPLVLALLTTRHISPAAVLLIAASTFAFLLRAPLQAWTRARHWGRERREPGRLAAIYAALAVVFGGTLILGWELWGLLVPAAIGAAVLGLNIYQSVRHEEKTLAWELTATGAMALTAPAAHYVALGRWTAEAWILWALSTAFFTSGVLYVKLRIAAMHEKVPGERHRLRVLCGAYHLLLGVLLVAAAFVWPARFLILVAFVPVLVRGLAAGAGPLPRLGLRKAGWLELTWSLIFLVVTSAAFQ